MALRHIRRAFLAGLLTVLPIALTIGVLLWTVSFVASLAGPSTAAGTLLQRLGTGLVEDETTAYLIGWVVVLACVFVLGLIVPTRGIAALRRRAEGAVEGLPMIGGLYRTAKKLTGMLDAENEADIAGMKVVYCKLGDRNGAKVLGLLATPETVTLQGRDYHVVLVPSAPVPISGALMLVPCESVFRARMSIDAFTSSYVSMGVTLPEHLSRASRPD